MATLANMHDRTRPRLLILGCSTRAAAWSAVRAGFFPVCADEFGDADLRQVAEVVSIPIDHAGRVQFAIHPTLVAAARLCVSDPLIFFVHSPEWDRLGGPYLGTPAGTNAVTIGWVLPVLSRQMQLPVLENKISPSSRIGGKGLWEELSNLEQIASLQGTALDRLNFFASRTDPPADGTWLQKPIRSGGGRGIRRWTAHAAEHPLREPSYFQRYQPGEPWSAVFLSDSCSAQLIGTSRQLIGDKTATPSWRFGYCGSIGPTTLPDPAASVLNRIAEELVRLTRLRGLFGIDFIWDGQTPWVVEVNPRYTASCEIFELALRRPLLMEHWRACLPDGDPPPEPLPLESRCGAKPKVLGKLIVYARERVVAPDFSRFLQTRSPWTVPFLADIPHVGTRFAPGQPVCTVFASGGDYDACYRKLVQRVERVRRWLGERL